ncbi:MAG: hypothetical protein HKN84_13975 [Gammaproteobacteria bacterium]|nr:hypothetical protein [Gammaproteobacteria bacterium]
MDNFRVVIAAVALGFGGTTAAQEWATYTSMEDHFRVHVPCEFSVETVDWESEYGSTLPARVYSCDAGSRGEYKVTVADYTNALDIYLAREGRNEADYVDLYWEIDIRASVIYAASQIRQREGEVTFDAYHYVDRVEGEQIQMTYPDERRLYAAIYLHNSKLYIYEATVDPRTPPPGMFQQSMGFVDEDGNRIRYQNFDDAPKVLNAPDRAERARLRELRRQQREQNQQ